MNASTIVDQPLAVLGGPRAVDREDEPDLFHWPMVTKENEDAIVQVLRDGDGKPTSIAFADRNTRQGPGSLPVTERMVGRLVGVPYFKLDRPDAIERHAAAYRKVIQQADRLLKVTWRSAKTSGGRRETEV